MVCAGHQCVVPGSTGGAWPCGPSRQAVAKANRGWRVDNEQICYLMPQQRGGGRVRLSVAMIAEARVAVSSATSAYLRPAVGVADHPRDAAAAGHSVAARVEQKWAQLNQQAKHGGCPGASVVPAKKLRPHKVPSLLNLFAVQLMQPCASTAYQTIIGSLIGSCSDSTHR